VTAHLTLGALDLLREAWRKATPKEQAQFRLEIQRRTALTADEVREIRARLAKGEGVAWIARRFGVSTGRISNINLRRSWGHLDP
jgi:hypothetical protein